MGLKFRPKASEPSEKPYFNVFRSELGGKKWIWCLWEPIPNGRVIRAVETGFETQAECLTNLRRFRQIVSNAETL